MPAQESTSSPGLQARVLRLQLLTVVWMGVEAVVALTGAWTAHSSALLAFGGDSAIELLSALIVFRLFHSPSLRERAEQQMNKVAGGLLLALAIFVASESALSLIGRVAPQRSIVGIVLLAVAAAVMPWLAVQKRKLSAATNSAALRADAAESAVCGYLALIALAGLALNAVWNIRWADPLAALAILPFILREGWQAMKGKACAD